MMPQAQRIQLLIALLVMSIGIIFFIDPVPQDLSYHNFADTRGWLSASPISATLCPTQAFWWSG